jgi:shikimate dehydrogenase
METNEIRPNNKIKPETYYIIGYPLHHSISPNIYNEIFTTWKLNAIYKAFPIKPDELPSKVRLLKEDHNIEGFNVTIPHKISIISFLDEIHKEAEIIGAVNTVTRKNGKLIGFNTDGIGLLNALQHHVTLSFSRIAIIGAGGAARAAIYKLSKYADEIHVFSLTGNTAIATANYFKKLGLNIIGHKAEQESYSKILPTIDLLINASPVGTLNDNETPIPPQFLKEGIIVMDMVYNPLKTKLINIALEKKCKIIDGLWMLAYQIIENLDIWFSIRPSITMIRKIGIKYLTGDFDER